MKKINIIITSTVVGFILIFGSCKKESSMVDTSQIRTELIDYTIVIPEILKKYQINDTTISVPEEKIIPVTKDIVGLRNKNGNRLQWNEPQHNQFVYIAAKKLGLSDERAEALGEASEMPDVFQAGFSNHFNQQWSHAFMYSYAGLHIWGDAHTDFAHNLDGKNGNTSEGEGYNSKSAAYYYNQGNQELGDWYVGYACHYISDVCIVVHSTFILPYISIATHHFDFEEWVEVNWTEGHKFVEAAKSVSPEEFYNITDPEEALRKAAKGSNYFWSDNGKKTWDAYGDCDYPTGVGEGCEEVVEHTKIMIREATKWTGGALKYALTKNKQL